MARKYLCNECGKEIQTSNRISFRHDPKFPTALEQHFRAYRDSCDGPYLTVQAPDTQADLDIQITVCGGYLDLCPACLIAILQYELIDRRADDQDAH
tara:strand:+ start:259 stop:549 length:291 start_codon:yes stop_codon:yes gene_type:complete